jgi:hypothetical protein
VAAAISFSLFRDDLSCDPIAVVQGGELDAIGKIVNMSRSLP